MPKPTAGPKRNPRVCRCGVTDKCAWPLLPGWACKIGAFPALLAERDSLRLKGKNFDDLVSALAGDQPIVPISKLSS